MDTADCLDVLAVSPGNCKGTCDVFDVGALMPEVPVPIAADPVAAPLVAPAPNPVEKPDGKGCVGTLSGSAPVPTVDAVWACAAVMPSAVMIVRKNSRIAFLLRAFSQLRCGTTRGRDKSADEVSEGWNWKAPTNRRGRF
ncbi:MAG TPA: hypothetical protein VFL62_03065 [Bradyrhizobium sp.]|uniref:hypothetical protein n=1 Tax=Bradyrhizobium sp. TaxID=376 RepID=UPI002D7F3FAE|nr:hypothetical protein [Bradyrhizobium sp.]HET7885186.1 hypothetical protein [Bradyrhizobium sp.]